MGSAAAIALGRRMACGLLGVPPEQAEDRPLHEAPCSTLALQAQLPESVVLFQAQQVQALLCLSDHVLRRDFLDLCRSLQVVKGLALELDELRVKPLDVVRVELTPAPLAIEVNKPKTPSHGLMPDHVGCALDPRSLGARGRRRELWLLPHAWPQRAAESLDL